MKPLRFDTNLLNASATLRKLILENPDLPIVYLAGENTNTGDYQWVSCSVRAEKGEVLECSIDDAEEGIFTDRDDLEEYLADHLYDFDSSDEEFDIRLEKKMAEFKPYWTPCILLFVDN